MEITIWDVVAHQSVIAAITACCRDMEIPVATIESMHDVELARGVDGWPRTLDTGDYAIALIRTAITRRNARPSEVFVIDPDTGCEANGVDRFDNGRWTGEVTWTDESVIELVCPTFDEAIQHPRVFAQMMRAVVSRHKVMSHTGQWWNLLSSCRAIVSQCDGIKP